IDPLIMIDKYGADAFRFSLAAFAAQGRDIKFSEDRVEGYKNFINKLWNAAKFILMNLPDDFRQLAPVDEWSKDLDITGRWILSRLSLTTQEVDEALSQYRFNDAATEVYQFIWHEFCDWYIELSKPVLYSEEESALKTATRHCLVYILENILKLLHPFMPFVTEELWQSLPHTEGSIMIKEYPLYRERDQKAEQEMEIVIDAISGIRSIRGELNIAPSKELDVILKPDDADSERVLRENSKYISKMAKTSSITIASDATGGKGIATSVREHVEVYIPLEGLLDVDSEIGRLNKDLKKLTQNLMTLEKKLLNEDFLSKAPREVVEKEKRRYNELTEKKEKLLESIKRLEELKGE
ncbi:MAG: valine--tRNA ligase, partial [Nitrospirae bacterium]